MTLKEQSSTIDRLSKENFDLKMRIHFLNEALNKRSEEGIKEMISENVELKSDKLKLQKDNQGLKRRIRDLEKQLKDHQSDKESMVNHDPEGSEGDRDSAQDGEVVYLRERVETYELEIERLRSESVARESEKRRLAEMVKSLSENRAGGSDAGAREERVCNCEYHHLRSALITSCHRICGKICLMRRLLRVSKPKMKTEGCGMRRPVCGARCTLLPAAQSLDSVIGAVQRFPTRQHPTRMAAELSLPATRLWSRLNF
jgi:hypothetical protein